MSGTEFFKDDLFLEVGRIAVIRGHLRFWLLSTGDALLATRLGDQGIVRLMMLKRELPELCETLKGLAEVQGVPREAVEQFDGWSREFRADFERAAEVANASWTYLGGVEEPHYGVYLGEITRSGDLHPEWRHWTVDELKKLRERLERAVTEVKPFQLACRVASEDRWEEGG